MVVYISIMLVVPNPHFLDGRYQTQKITSVISYAAECKCYIALIIRLKIKS